MADKVLVVDDEEDFCRLMVLHLKRRGYDAIGVSDPNEGVKIVENAGKDVFGVVVTDWMMPHMSGNALITKIHEIDPNVVPIAITAVEQMGKVAVLGYGAIEYLVKPLDHMRQLSEAVERAMELHESRSGRKKRRFF
jgi:DNA-binding NtrC family response regulator